eukprot:4635469-Prymnesium_polylepis.1
MMIVDEHGRSDPSISGCNTSPQRSDAHRGRTSGGVSRQQSLMCTRRRVSARCARAWYFRVCIRYRKAYIPRLKPYGGLRDVRAMSWCMGGRAIVGRRCAQRVVRGGG